MNSEVRVLLVDDNPDDVSIIRRLLGQYQSARFRILSVNSTSSCLELLGAAKTDLIMLDHSMPAEDGIAFLRRAAGLVNLPPVIIVTGQGDYRLVAEAIRSGASDCIYKHAMTSQLLGQAALQALAKFRHDEELSRYDQNIIDVLVRTSSHVDPTAGGERLAGLAQLLGRSLSLNQYQVEILNYGAILHDIGKLGIRNELIIKPGPLTDSEFDEVRCHPLIGERMCTPLRLARELCPIIRHHHERWDGKGYVDGLVGEDIPLLARVISVVDAYDAMTTDRPYRPALDPDEARSRLGAGAGTQWDPRVIAAFADVIEPEHPLELAA